MFELNDDNFLIFAIKSYDNRGCLGMSDLEEDLKRFKYIKRLFRRYETTDVLSERLILNHLVVIYNLFGVKAATDMLFLKIDKKHWPQLKSFLIYLNVMPPDNMLIVQDEKVLESLRKI